MHVLSIASASAPFVMMEKQIAWHPFQAFGENSTGLGLENLQRSEPVQLRYDKPKALTSL